LFGFGKLVAFSNSEKKDVMVYLSFGKKMSDLGQGYNILRLSQVIK